MEKTLLDFKEEKKVVEEMISGLVNKFQKENGVKVWSIGIKYTDYDPNKPVQVELRVEV